MPKRRLLSGNYEVEVADPGGVVDVEKTDEEFQKAALTRLGGSIAFVRGRKLVEEG